jgi:large subunit ribosomal protein L17
MRHRIAGRKLGRTTAHRQALLRNLSKELLEKEKIKTTLSKAKELQPYAEKLVTLSKRETLHARRLVLRKIQDKKVVAKLFDALSARYAQRPGGYTRVIKLGPRPGDNAEMAIIELVEAESVHEGEASGEGKGKGKARKTKKKAAAKKPEAKKAGTARKAKAAAEPKKKDAGKKKAAKKAAKAPSRKKKAAKAD